MSLFDAAERFASLDRSQVILDARRCLHTMDQFSECSACFETCPVHAITPGKPPVLDMEACQSCLACIPACPMGAYQADDDVSSLLNCATHVEGKSIELLCGLHPHPEGGVEAESTGIQVQGCLAGLGVGAYLSLSALEMERVILRMDACRDCKWAALAKKVADDAKTAKDILGAWGRSEQLAIVDAIPAPVERPFWDAKNPPLSRRDLFRMMGRQGRMAVARAMEQDHGTTARQPGRERRRLLGALGHLPAMEHLPAVRLDGFAMLAVSEACSACSACARACPTEALKFDKNEAVPSFSLAFLPESCIGCELCVHACAPAAIAIEPAPAFEQVFSRREPVMVRSGKLVRCDHCRSWMAERPGKKLCDLCEYRIAHPFGSVMPPGMQLRGSRPAKDPRS